MNISGPFIRRPVATSLLAFGVLLSGAIAFWVLPISSLPQIEFATIQVEAKLPGADPVTVATSISAPLERRLALIAGVNEITSMSVLGKSNITVQFDLSQSVDSAARDAEAAINASLADLPANLPSHPKYQKASPTDAPIIILALTSDTLPPGDVYNFAYDVVMQKLSQLEGVGQIEASGSEKSAVRVQANPAYLASMGLSLEDVRDFLAKANANLPKGSIDGPDVSYALHVNDQLFSAADYESLVPFQKRGSAIRMSDLGHVVDSVDNIRQIAWSDGKPAVLLFVFKQTGANIIETVDRIRVLLPAIMRWAPPALHLAIVQDRTETIRTSVNHIEFTLCLSIALVVMVVFMFLRHFWATVIPSITVPLSLAGTFGVMYLAGYTLDNLSLMALAVVVGFVVDDAIVVIENIFRCLEAGDAPREAAMKGARQIGFTVVSMTLSLIAVFIPLVFMTGIVGRMLHEFAVTLTAAIVVSGVVSLTFTPMMCSQFLRHEKSETEPNRLFRILEYGFVAMQGLYERCLKWVLRHEGLMLGVALGTMVASAALYVVVPKGFFPIEDTGRISSTIEAGQDVSYQSFLEKTQQVIAIVRKDPAVRTVAGYMGGGSNQGQMWVTLTPLEDRKMSVQEVIARIRKKVAKLEGVTLYMKPAQELRVGSHSTKSTYQYTLQGSDLAELSNWSSVLMNALARTPHFQDVNTDLQSSGLQANVVVDREAAARLHVSFRAIDNTLYDAFGQRQVSTMYTALTQHHVILEASPSLQKDPHSLDQIYVKSDTGRMVPLSAVAHVDRTNTSLSISHLGQFPAVTLSFNLDPGYSLGQATDVIDQTAAALHMPGSIHGSFQGLAQVFEESLASEPLLILGALLAVYAVLGILYESLIHPLTILSTLPSAGVGALLALLVTHSDLTIVALIGIILLIGLVKKNAIMMIDFAIETERGGMNPKDAILRACLVRFRPIMMTTLAALFGALPLALGGGVGAELHKPLGISIVGGLIVSQLLTLFTTPVVYLAMDRLQRRLGRRRRVKNAIVSPPRMPLPEAG